ncbi:hypothetical protein FRC17_004383 [Serendipita sp. 399]|nr:hypothetical protein FRC17_004383 [Serendipita sp. 399]
MPIKPDSWLQPAIDGESQAATNARKRINFTHRAIPRPFWQLTITSSEKESK